MNNKSYVTVCVNTGVGHYSAMNGVIVTQKSCNDLLLHMPLPYHKHNPLTQQGCNDPPLQMPLIYHKQTPSNKWGLFMITLDMQKYSQIK